MRREGGVVCDSKPISSLFAIAHGNRPAASREDPLGILLSARHRFHSPSIRLRRLAVRIDCAGAGSSPALWILQSVIVISVMRPGLTTTRVGGAEEPSNFT